MELGERIKKYRNEKALSQDALSEKIYVSRQTISNWENGKSYPDVNNLVLLSEVFDVSLDQLIKGDVEIMKEEIEISKEDQKKFEQLSNVFAVLFFVAMITPIPLAHYLSNWGIAIWLVILAAALYLAIRVEKEKKKLDIQSYREIVAFTDGRTLDEIEKAREEAKRPYQKILLALASAVITLCVCLLLARILGEI